MGGILMPDKSTIYFAGIEDAQYKEQKLGFWRNVYGFDMSCVMEDVITEPLVDVVQPHAIITDSVGAFTIDLYNVKVGDLNFKSNLQLTFSRNDYLHALISFFDVEFTKCHARTGFSTAPYNAYTHWKQTVFYLDEDLMVSQGTKIDLTIDVKANDNNPRDIDIKIDSIYQSDKTGRVDQ